MKYFKLDNKINELRDFAENGLKDVKNTGLASLDGYLGLKKGFPIFIGGAPHSGKTEFTFELLINTSILYRWKHFIYCGEGGNAEHIYYELLHKYLQKPYKYADEKERASAEYFISEHFVIANHDYDFTIDEFYKTVTEAELEYAIKFDTTTFDPFNDAKDESEKFNGRDDKYLAYVLKKVRVSSKINNRIDIIVNHIADIRPVIDKDGNRYIPFALPNEWAGGRTWWRRAFVMLLIYRPPNFLKDIQGMAYADNETHVHIQKAKPKGVAKLGVRSIFWDWKKNRYYCFEGSQKLYSCQLAPVIQTNLQPNRNFESVKEYTETEMPF
jgi:hypothetical protein